MRGLRSGERLPYPRDGADGRSGPLGVERERLRRYQRDDDRVYAVDEQVLAVDAEAEDQGSLPVEHVPLTAVAHRHRRKVTSEVAGGPGLGVPVSDDVLDPALRDDLRGPPRPSLNDQMTDAR